MENIVGYHREQTIKTQIFNVSITTAPEYLSPYAKKCRR